MPLLPHLADALLALWTLLTRPGIAAAVEAVRAAVLGWEGVTSVPHRFGGCEFRIGGREIGHLHGNGVLDLPFPRAVKERLVAEGRGREHHTHPGTGWLSFPIQGQEDAAPALELLRLSCTLKASPPAEE